MEILAASMKTYMYYPFSSFLLNQKKLCAVMLSFFLSYFSEISMLYRVFASKRPLTGPKRLHVFNES